MEKPAWPTATTVLRSTCLEFGFLRQLLVTSSPSEKGSASGHMQLYSHHYGCTKGSGLRAMLELLGLLKGFDKSAGTSGFKPADFVWLVLNRSIPMLFAGLPRLCSNWFRYYPRLLILIGASQSTPTPASIATLFPPPAPTGAALILPLLSSLSRHSLPTTIDKASPLKNKTTLSSCSHHRPVPTVLFPPP
ncbi:hypothetical protein L1887_43245 [Cichorium endivia]|nr:hypothetical protein L1887_43245 [Cichorium endivia]